ncbi:hypothetical protein SDC9_118210 [bioreactor metagenome]|uniref:Stage III sporulation protein AG n=1 Tax=bioreactor metagenome TaxID=1076179 RepID=A0A645C1Y3_9ZZZZ
MLLFILGIALILLSRGGDEAAVSAVPESSEFNTEEFTSRVEQKLGSMISGIKGAGRVSVMVTIDTGTRKIYAAQTNTKSSGVQNESSEEFVWSQDKSGAKTPVLIAEQTPSVRGVAVVCEGAINSEVRKKVIELVSCALDLPTNKICVTN